MFFRFGSTLFLVVLVSLAGIALEKQNLALRREVSRQSYRMDVLLDEHSRLRLTAQRLGAPIRLIDPLEHGEFDLQQPEQPLHSDLKSKPLLRWQLGAPLPR